MSERLHHQQFCFLAAGAKSLGGLGDRIQRRFQGGIEHLIALFAETLWLHAAAEQVKPEIEISGILGVIPEERHRRAAKSIGGRLSAQDCTADGLSKICQRISKNLRVDLFLGLEVKIESGGRVTCRSRDRPQ